jgi:hypothetical protein
MSNNSRVYAVKIHGDTPKARLVRASNVAAAIRHVAESLVYAEVAKQDTLIDLIAAGVRVEDAAREVEATQEQAALAAE